ncbi:M23 family metallopeptidase [Propionibacteriaceae bacterium Y1700]|uniref:M23 family metallopeptidase n=1 Tax=Microlunatus sp. Y1700 TaxID=3418487 RepID=UPI003DA75FB5
MTPSASASPTSSSPTSASPSREPEPKWDRRNKFYSSDKSLYTSDWYEGRGRIMINFGCTEAPYYDPSPKCSGGQGFHHGTDVALPCGTALHSAVKGTVTDPGRAGTPGPSYGSKAFRIHDQQRGVDILIAHASKVFVSPGDTVAVGDRIALAGAEGAPDGCHLHLEVRPARGGVSSAVDPADVLDLTEAR